MKRKTIITLFVFLTVFTSSCSGALTSTDETYVVSGNTDGAPVGCSPKEIAGRMVEMLDAINRADLKVVDEYFGRKDGAPFQWYSLTEIGETDIEKNHFAAYHWDDLAGYFNQRYQQHEHMELRSIHFNEWDAERGLVHFGPIELSRQADDLRSGGGDSESLVTGKGAYHCSTKTFVVFSLVMNLETD